MNLGASESFWWAQVRLVPRGNDVLNHGNFRFSQHFQTNAEDVRGWANFCQGLSLAWRESSSWSKRCLAGKPTAKFNGKDHDHIYFELQPNIITLEHLLTSLDQFNVVNFNNTTHFLGFLATTAKKSEASPGWCRISFNTWLVPSGSERPWNVSRPIMVPSAVVPTTTAVDLKHLVGACWGKAYYCGELT